MLKPEAAKLHKLCSDIAFFLNAGEQSPVWEHSIPADEERADYPSQDIMHASNPEIHMNVRIGTYGAEKDRVQISGNFHIRQGYHEDYQHNIVPNVQFMDVREWHNGGYSALPSISCSPTKTPEQIAKDIKRRFLPEYLPLIHKAIQRRDDHERYQNQANQHLKELAAVVDYPTAKIKPDAQSFSAYQNNKAYAHEVQTNDKGETSLKLSNLTLDQAKRILAIVAEDRKPEVVSMQDRSRELHGKLSANNTLEQNEIHELNRIDGVLLKDDPKGDWLKRA